MSVAGVKSHRVLYANSARQVSIADVNGIAHVEQGDIAAIVPKFQIPVRGMVDSVMLSGRAFVSCLQIARWATAFEKKAMPDQAQALRRLAEWANDESRRLANGKR